MPLIDGAKVWHLHATHGFPLEMSIPLLWDRGIIPTWKELIDSAKRDGAKRIKDRLSAIIGDTYPPEMKAEMRRRLYKL